MLEKEKSAKTIVQETFALQKLFKFASDLYSNPQCSFITIMILVAIELIINILIISSVKYTEIDWKAYMQEVEGFLNGSLNYYELRGDTGPLVYPAGFVYIYSLFYLATSNGTNIRLAQIAFMLIYIVFLCNIFFIYYKARNVPPIVYILVSLFSHRIHSIFILRLFNDPVAMLFLYISIVFMLHQRWISACVFYSFAVSIKMNVLLFAPGIFIILVLIHGFRNTIFYINLCAVVQLLMGAPFLLTHPIAYIHRSFEFSRQFLYEWTVNWKCIPEEIFISRFFHMVLLVLHVTTLLIFNNKFLREFGGLKGLLFNQKKINKLDSKTIIYILFSSNFIGICFSRSLHYQFLVWYYHSFVYLVWNTTYPTIYKSLNASNKTWQS